jgi:hypothetical protein
MVSATHFRHFGSSPPPGGASSPSGSWQGRARDPRAQLNEADRAPGSHGVRQPSLDDVGQFVRRVVGEVALSGGVGRELEGFNRGQRVELSLPQEHGVQPRADLPEDDTLPETQEFRQLHVVGPARLSSSAPWSRAGARSNRRELLDTLSRPSVSEDHVANVQKLAFSGFSFVELGRPVRCHAAPCSKPAQRATKWSGDFIGGPAVHATG